MRRDEENHCGQGLERAFFVGTEVCKLSAQFAEVEFRHLTLQAHHDESCRLRYCDFKRLSSRYINEE